MAHCEEVRHRIPGTINPLGGFGRGTPLNNARNQNECGLNAEVDANKPAKGLLPEVPLEPQRCQAPPRTRPVSFIPYDQLKIGKTIGKGGFGTVFQAKWGFSECAVKAIRRDHPSHGDEKDSNTETLREAELHHLLAHPHVIQFFGVSFNPSDYLQLNYFLVMQYIEGPNLFDAIFDPEGCDMNLTSDQKTALVNQICDAVRYLHDGAHIVHKDIKPHNILVERSTKKAFVTDFGMSKLSEDIISQYTLGARGSLPYMAPELLTHSENSGRLRSPSFSSDIWSLGATLTELYTGKRLYGEKRLNVVDLIRLKRDDPVALGFATSIQRQLVSPMLDSVPGKRPTASQLMEILRLLTLTRIPRRSERVRIA